MKTASIGTQDWKPFKKAFKHVVQNRAGYQSELNSFGKKITDTFNKQGFIKSENVSGHKIYNVTPQGDMYYRSMYGVFDWTYQFVKGVVKRYF